MRTYVCVCYSMGLYFLSCPTLSKAGKFDFGKTYPEKHPRNMPLVFALLYLLEERGAKHTPKHKPKTHPETCAKHTPEANSLFGNVKQRHTRIDLFPIPFELLHLGGLAGGQGEPRTKGCPIQAGPFKILKIDVC